MDFKVSYLDAGLTNSYFSDSDQLIGSSGNHSNSSSSSVLGGTSTSTPQRLNRRYKTQLRDFLSTCRTKRKLATHHSSPVAVGGSGVAVSGVAVPGVGVGVEYMGDTSAAAAVAAAYNMYSAPYPATPATDNVYMGHSGNFHQSLYDNRFLTSTENLFHQYRPLGTYYTEYHHPATTPYNGFLDISPRSGLPTYETTSSVHHQLAKSSDCDKLYSCHQSMEQKYSPVMDNRGYVSGKCSDYSMAPVVTVPLCGEISQVNKTNKSVVKTVDNISPVVSSPSAVGNGLVTPKLEDIKSDVNMLHYTPTSEVPRQTVLMWGSGGNTTLNHTPTSSTGSCRSPSAEPSTPIMANGVPSPYLQEKKYMPGTASDPLKSLAEMNSMSESKWKPETPPSPKTYYQPQHYGSEGEVWTPHHQYYPYHHHHQ